MGARIKRREVMKGIRRIKSEKLREHQYIGGYARCLHSKRVEWDEDRNVEHIGEQVKWAMADSTKEVCGSVKVEVKNPKNVWCNDEVKAAVEKK